MKESFNITETWKLYTMGSIIGCTFLIFFAKHNHNSMNITVPKSMGLEAQFPISSNVNENGKLGNSSAGNNHGRVNNSTPPYTGTTITSSKQSPVSSMEKSSPPNVSVNGKLERIAEGKCNMFEGRWVYKPIENPIYGVSTCPFLSAQVSCRRNGRLDFDYDKWSWEARECEIPRFNGTNMLERLRGKRLIIVGDSLNRNQWESLACLLYSSVPSSRAYVDSKTSGYKVFKAKDYDCTVEFYWSPFLVQLKERRNGTRVLRLDKLSASSRRWNGADIMVFNTGHWWVHRGKLRAWDLFQYRGKLVENMEIESALKTGMKTWARWIDSNIDPNRTRVFFRSISPTHNGKQNCSKATQPLMDESYKDYFPKQVIQIIKKRIKRMRTPVRYLNITKLSQYRIDAHSSIYAGRPFSDCSHWCLPGLPDTWNRLLYAIIAHRRFY